jgi:hypothetical protein
MTPTIFKTSKDAESVEEYRKIREGEKIPAEPSTPKTQPQSEPEAVEEVKEPPAEGESASVSETESQENKPKRNHKAEARIDELTARNKRFESEIAELRQKLAEKPQQPSAETKPEVKEEPKRPKLKDFIEGTQAKNGETYEDAHSRYEDAVDEWHDRRVKAAVAELRKDAENKTMAQQMKAKIDAAKLEFPDFEETAMHVKTGSDAIANFVLQSPDGLRVLYTLAKNPAEHQRIVGLDPMFQFAELGRIAAGLTVSSERPPQPVAVPKAAPPPPRISGESRSVNTHPSKATSLEQYKQLRAQR